MCWIFAYNWKENAIPLLVEGLRNLEYRGYDSAGVFWIDNSGNKFLEKSVWKVSNLAMKVEKSSWLSYRRKYTPTLFRGWKIFYSS